MNEVRHVTLAQVREFLAGTTAFEFKAQGEDAERYRWVAQVLRPGAAVKLPEKLGIVAERTGQKKIRISSCRPYVALLSR